MTQIDIALLAIVTASGVALHGLVTALWPQGPPVGDENEYLVRGRSSDPLAPGPSTFVRVPVMPLLARCLVPRFGARGLRMSMVLVSVLGIIATARAGSLQAGPVVGAIAAAVLLVTVENAALAHRLWPDPLLGLWMAALVLVLSSTGGSPWTWWVAGLLVAGGSLTRIDFIGAAPGLAFAALRGHADPGAVVATVLPLTVCLLALTLHNARRYGIAAPDTTWAFNLMVAATPDQGSVRQTVQHSYRRWKELSFRNHPGAGLHALRTLVASEGHTLGVARRVAALLGPDTFVRQRLLTATTAEGPPPGLWSWLCRLQLPLIWSIVLVGWVTGSVGLPHWCWPAVGVAATAVAFHFRTRYRISILPPLTLLAAHVIADWSSRKPGELAVLLCLAAALTVLLARIPWGREIIGDA